VPVLLNGSGKANVFNQTKNGDVQAFMSPNQSTHVRNASLPLAMQGCMHRAELQLLGSLVKILSNSLEKDWQTCNIFLTSNKMQLLTSCCFNKPEGQWEKNIKCVQSNTNFLIRGLSFGHRSASNPYRKCCVTRYIATKYRWIFVS